MSQSPAVDEPLTRAQAWTCYWSSGVQHSCPGSFAANYTGRIGDFWKSVFEALPSDARVLDACCGNAPMSQMLLDSDYGGASRAWMRWTRPRSRRSGWMPHRNPCARASCCTPARTSPRCRWTTPRSICA